MNKISPKISFGFDEHVIPDEFINLIIDLSTAIKKPVITIYTPKKSKKHGTIELF